MVSPIVHLDIPDFCTSLEELRRPELKKHPLVLAEISPRSIVQGVNGIARTEGIRTGMPLPLAQRLCRRLVAVPPDVRYYHEQHQNILEDLSRFSPLVEGTLPGRYFVDLTGTKRLWGPYPDTASRMSRHLFAGKALKVRAGLASNKLVSHVVTNCIAPGDLSCIFPGGESAFLAPLPVTFLPGIGTKTSARLLDFNIERIGQIASLSAAMLRCVLGRMGPRLLDMAQGIDTTPILPFRQIPKFSFTHNLERDEIDQTRLQAILFQQAEEAGWMLRRHNRYPGRFGLEVRYADGVTVHHTCDLSPVSAHSDRRLFQAVLHAFNRLVQRRIAIRRIVLEFFNFTMPLRQLPLFPLEESSFQEDLQLQHALDDIRHRFGRHSISWGKTVIEGLR